MSERKEDFLLSVRREPADKITSITQPSAVRRVKLSVSREREKKIPFSLSLSSPFCLLEGFTSGLRARGGIIDSASELRLSKGHQQDDGLELSALGSVKLRSRRRRRRRRHRQCNVVR